MRIRHDDPSITTLDGSIETYGATTRPVITCPADDAVSTDDVLRIVLDGDTYYTHPVTRDQGTVTIAGAYAMPGQARDPGGATNELDAWLDATELTPGRTVHIDIVSPGYMIGVRAPGETAAYKAGEPDQSLSDIAEDL